MKINKSGAALSKIVQTGVKLARLERESGKEYLPLNRGVNAVVNIDIKETVANLDFSSNEMLTYPPGKGIAKLRDAINQEYFLGKSNPDNILITAGGMPALDLIVQTVGMKKLFLPVYYWGCYFQMLTIRNIGNAEYHSQAELFDRLDELKGNAVLICDPGNPLGEKYDDQEQLQLIKMLSDNDVTVFFDSPYRKIFFDNNDTYYSELLKLDNVIITESFSKSVGLSGQRLGFIHTTNNELRDELEIRLMFCTNGINAFAQLLVHSLLTSDEGRKAANEFKTATARDIALNIQYLRNRGLLADKFYENVAPKGIFTVVNRTEEQLLEHNIGSVSLTFFTKSQKEDAAQYARICVSQPHEKFVRFFDNVK